MNLVVIGAGGHGKVCAEIADLTGEFQNIYFSDDQYERGVFLHRWQVSFHDKDIASLDPKEYFAFIGVGHVRLGAKRRQFYSRVVDMGFVAPAIVSPRAYVSPTADICPGVLVGHMVVVNSNASIGENAIVNTGAIIEHDASVGAHVHISTGAVVNGACRIGAESMLGSGATLIQGVTIAPNVIVGAGAVVTCNIEKPGVYVGIPAQRIDEEIHL